MTFKDWLNIFIDGNKLDRNHVFEIENEGTAHTMEFEVLVGSIIALPAEYQLKIKNKLLDINSENGDLMHYFNYVAEGFIISQISEVSKKISLKKPIRKITH